MSEHAQNVVNMANSIIGVSILSMPYCFREAGIVLGMLLILFSGYITKKTCMFLVQSAIMSRRRSYELLAFQTLGTGGKLLIEMSIILYLIGICVSFHVVMGDLAPSIVAKYMFTQNSPSLRCTLLIGIAVLVILPLCLLRKLDSLTSMSLCSICFYVLLNALVLYVALPRLIDGSWVQQVEMFNVWKVFTVLPIMSLALSCQSNVFEIYNSLPDPDVIKMENVVSQAVNLCCAVYIGMGFFGYLAFLDKDPGGNIIMSFPDSVITDAIKIIFAVSLAISFPLMMFPCRTSINSLFFRRNVQAGHDLIGNFIPESRFKWITLSILMVSLAIGILLPNIEYVLGVLGSTMGTLIAYILPSMLFIKVSSKLSTERLLSQGILLFGALLMVMGTFLHVKQNSPTSEEFLRKEHIVMQATARSLVQQKFTNSATVPFDDKKIESLISEVVRREPVIPEPPPNGKSEAVALPKVDSVLNDVSVMKKEELGYPGPKGKGPGLPKIVKLISEEAAKEGKAMAERSVSSNWTARKEGDADTLHPDAILKEEKEKDEETAGKEKDSKLSLELKQEEILLKLESQQKQQAQLLEEQKKILQELKDHREKDIASQPLAVKDVEFKVDDGLNIKDKNLVIVPQIVGSIPPVLHMSSVPDQDPNLALAPADVKGVVAEVVDESGPNGVNSQVHKNVHPRNIPVVSVQDELVLGVVSDKEALAQRRRDVEKKPEDEDVLKQLGVQDVPLDLGKPHWSGKSSVNSQGKPVDSAQPLSMVSPVSSDPEAAAHEKYRSVWQSNVHSADVLNKNIVVGQSSGDEHNSKESALHESPPLLREKEGKAANLPVKKTSKKVIVSPANEENPGPREIPVHRPEDKNNPSKQDVVARVNREDSEQAKHDEERKKRDLSSVMTSNVVANPDVQLEGHLSQADIQRASNEKVEAVYDTRQLLWIKTRRRKKRRANAQYPDYWDEM